MTARSRARRVAGSAGAMLAAGALAAVAAIPAQAAPVGYSVLMTVHNDFTVDAPAPFDSNLPGCESGTVVDASPGSRFLPWGGTYVGTKEFTCTGGGGGFDVQLRARFGGGGSTGTWVVSASWGTLVGMKGSGSLVGISLSETQLDDVYTGTVR